MDESLSLKSENIASQIFFLRGEKVMLDFELASLYEIETRVLKQQVRRNINRFPTDFMFQLSKIEWQELITNCDKLGSYKFSPSTPYAFTEQGVAMLSSIINNKKAIQVNIAIMRTFVQLRKLMDSNKDLALKIEEIEKKYDQQFQIIFKTIKQLIRQENEPRKTIGFKQKKK